MKTLLIILLSSLLMFLAGCANAPTASPSSSANALKPNVDVSEAAILRDNGAFVLDVRETYEWDAGHIPNATLIQLGTLNQRLNEIPKDKPIVVVCRSGNRSQKGRDVLLSAGFGQVTSMDGGMIAWQQANLPVEK
jgi:rhodanese-related sulfurtransferase